MKHAIIIIAMAAGLAHGQFNAVMSPTNIVDGSWTVTNTHPIVVTPKGVSDETVSNLISNGTVCRVLGKHVWTVTMFVDDNYAPTRKCDLCGRKETKQEVWKEDGQ